jgi:hypothetical protein
LQTPTLTASVGISSAGVTSKMSQRAASTGSDKRSGVVVTNRWTCEADSTIPRSASSGTSSVVA